jgi:hypothetical protein
MLNGSKALAGNGAEVDARGIEMCMGSSSGAVVIAEPRNGGVDKEGAP